MWIIFKRLRNFVLQRLLDPEEKRPSDDVEHDKRPYRIHLCAAENDGSVENCEEQPLVLKEVQSAFENQKQN